MIIFVDFDETICPDYSVETEPMEGAIETLQALKEAGNEIVIYSYRGNEEAFNTQKEIGRIVKYLHKFEIPYDGFKLGKPYFHAIIDDRAYNPKHTSWKEIGDKLLK